ncbi:endo-1,4-beta-xylanase [Consotaella aegiceratis]|uniref:endo-1,4-beta-xylanase n=1 Tax=Consotaella aegiceratis TaxID=3097961 RepID=UPI002F4126CA
MASALPRPLAAKEHRVPFGGAIQIDYFDDDPAYVQAFVDRCDLIMPMNALKFDLLRPDGDTFNFEPADRLVRFARDHGKLSRGHCFVWWGAVPAWLEAIDDPREAERILIDHIETVADRFAGRLTSWDVVNEVMAHDPRETGGPLRDTYWLRRLGPRHIPLAFQTAARADPSARLVINDYDLEFAGDRYDARRQVVLDIVRQLQDHNVPIHAVGVQGHLYAELAVDIEALACFGEALRRLGVGLLVTELDVIDWKIRGGPAEQDAAAEKAVSDLLTGLFAGQTPEAVICWGITDRYSWIPDVMPRPDGSPSRPLPLDADLRPKPWLETILARLG